MAPPQISELRSRGIVIGPMPGGVAITASVGRNGTNRREDARGVQTALNAVPRLFGGAGEKLKIDGLVGPLTIGAITTFQRRWLKIHDGRCDPGGPTLALLNAMAGVGDALPSGSSGIAARTGPLPATGAPPRGGTPNVGAPPTPQPPPSPPGPGPFPLQELLDERTRVADAELRQFVVERHHQPIVLRMLLTALRVNDAAKRHVGRLPGLLAGNAPPPGLAVAADRRAFLLVAKIFKLHERSPADAQAGVAQVDDILRQAMLLISRRVQRPPVVSPPPPAEAPLFVSIFGLPPQLQNRLVLGYTIRGGLHLSPGPSAFFNEFVVPGQVVQERVERIYLTPFFDFANSDFQRLVMIHELAHNVGPPGAAGITDIAKVDEPTWKTLTSFQRQHTADSYAFFATECSIGTLNAVNQAATTLDAIGEFPKVTATFVAPEPVITLPPAGDPRAAAFAFPAGFT